MPSAMNSVLLHRPAAAKPLALAPAPAPAPAPLSSPNYDLVLRDSLDRFLSGSCDLSAFLSVFFRLLQSTADPPLEVIWFYSAVTYSETAPMSKLAAVRDLLQLLTACSASSGGAKCIAVIAPAISELYKCVEEKKAREEIESLVEGIVSFISICCSNGSDGRDCDVGLHPCFLDLVRVWTVGRQGGGDGLGVFFPLVSDEVRDRIRVRGCDAGYLAGVVIAEAFLLRLCLKVLAGGASRVEVQKELKIWAVSSVTVFRNYAFFEILMMMLLEPMLPVMSLLKSEDENLIRDILYDVVILVDYSLLTSGMEEGQSYAYMKNIALTKLIVTHEAIRKARAKGDLNKAMSYTSAFSTSFLPNRIVKLVGNQIGVVGRPNAMTPHALLKWLVDLEGGGVRLFDDTISKLCGMVVFDEVKAVSEDLTLNSYSKKTDAELFFLDKQGEVAEGGMDEEMEPVDAAFRAVAQSMKSLTPNSGRKRKEWQGEGETPVKFVKYRIDDSSAKRHAKISADDVMNSGSEADSTTSDEDMEETVH